METTGLSETVASLLTEAGAVAFGSADADMVPDEEWRLFQDWLDKGHHAGMTYMENYPEIRRDPRLLLPGAKTIISVAFNYRQPNPFPEIATYALGMDYHKVLRKRLKHVVREVKARFGGHWRICVDSAPVLERYWAEKCGVGKRSPLHGNIVVPGAGSMVFLAELVTTLSGISLRGKSPAEEGESPEEVKAAVGCSVCRSGALQPDGTVDARLCVNYLTIECREELGEKERIMVGDKLFGCDVCLKVSGENSGTPLPVLPEFSPLPGLKEFLAGEETEFDISASPMARCDREILSERIKIRCKNVKNA